MDFFQRYPEAAPLQQLACLGWDEREGSVSLLRDGRRGEGAAARGSVPAALRELPALAPCAVRTYFGVSVFVYPCLFELIATR